MGICVLIKIYNNIFGRLFLFLICCIFVAFRIIGGGFREFRVDLFR